MPGRWNQRKALTKSGHVKTLYLWCRTVCRHRWRTCSQQQRFLERRRQERHCWLVKQGKPEQRRKGLLWTFFSCDDEKNRRRRDEWKERDVVLESDRGRVCFWYWYSKQYHAGFQWRDGRKRGGNEGNAVKQQQEALLYLTSSKMGKQKKERKKGCWEEEKRLYRVSVKGKGDRRHIGKTCF